MDLLLDEKYCKYCNEKLELCTDEGLDCIECQQLVHVKCLKRGSVPSGLCGDVFYQFTCSECSITQNEIFTRTKISWLQIITLVLYHLLKTNPGLARKQFFHWRNHISTFIDRKWDSLFPRDTKKKKKWMGTVAGTLSHFSSYLFLSGTPVIHEPAWWTLTYPKLSPLAISNIYSLLTVEKQKAKINNEKKSDADLFHELLVKYIQNEEFSQSFSVNLLQNDEKSESSDSSSIQPIAKRKILKNKRKVLLPTIDSSSKKLLRLNSDLTNSILKPRISEQESKQIQPIAEMKTSKVKLLDPFCHYNTSLSNLSRLKGQQMFIKLMGGIRKELIYSPYSGIYLKPFIRRDNETFPLWLRLMADIQLNVNRKLDKFYILPNRAPIDFTYVQPDHIPAINSLCNQFFWPGIDLTESLQYPDFSCVALYKKLIIGFAFVVPDVKFTENYISFLFTRPNWRNCGIATFMLYHLIQTSLGKDLTLHVSINNSALFLYQKFGFKVEQIEQCFYEKYYRDDVKESKHAFFCRLER